MPQNEAFNHAGNAAAALLAGLVGRLVAPVALFYLAVAFEAASILCVLAVPRGEIDHAARGAGARRARRRPAASLRLGAPPRSAGRSWSSPRA